MTSTGEKVPPADLEAAIETDPLFSQCYVIGENRPYLSLITVVNPDEWASFAKSCGVDPADPASLDNPSVKTAALKRAKTAAGEFPHYALPRRRAHAGALDDRKRPHHADSQAQTRSALKEIRERHRAALRHARLILQTAAVGRRALQARLLSLRPPASCTMAQPKFSAIPTHMSTTSYKPQPRNFCRNG